MYQMHRAMEEKELTFDEEAIARIDRFEERLAKGEVKWVSSEDFTKQLFEEFPWLK